VKSGAKLWWAVGVCAALLVGFVGGVWVGAENEHHVMLELLTRANLDENCRAPLGDAMQAIIDEYEGKPASPYARSCWAIMRC
jgi:hypothetical protein